jgi:O-glycosyl hydrolase
MLGSASPNGLKDNFEVKRTWAKYISYFIDAYKAHGVPIWAVTPQNEPEVLRINIYIYIYIL